MPKESKSKKEKINKTELRLRHFELKYTSKKLMQRVNKAIIKENNIVSKSKLIILLIHMRKLI